MPVLWSCFPLKINLVLYWMSHFSLFMYTSHCASHSCPSDNNAPVFMWRNIFVLVASLGRSGMGMHPSSFACMVAPFAHATWMGSGRAVIFVKLIFPLEQ